MKTYAFEHHDWAEAAWQQTGTDLDTVWVSGQLTKDKAAEFGDAKIVSVDISILDKAVLEQLPNLVLIAVRSTGADRIDFDHCAAAGITVCNVPGYAQNAVAEHAFALLLSLGRHMVAAAKRTKQFDFSWDGIQAFELFGKTIAVIGTGAIGRRAAAIAKGFDMTVVAYDAFVDEEWAAAAGVKYLPLDEALRAADFVTLHVPGTPETYHLLSEARFALMKPGVVLINTARGDVVDPCALLRALESGKVAAAGLDVLPDENQILSPSTRLEVLEGSGDAQTTALANHLLLQHPRVVVTPHCAFFTKEAAATLMQTTVDNIAAYLRGTPQNVLNPTSG